MFLLSQNNENQSENGSKNSKKSASGPGHLRNRKKRCCKPKNWGQKVEKHGFFSLFACRFWTGAFTNRCLPYCFLLQCFLKASVTTYQKQQVLAEKCPPPGKPVTFYECHPEDHAPAPSVRADFLNFLRLVFVWKSICRTLYTAICHSPHAKRDVGCESLLWVSCPGSETAERNSSFLVQHGDRLQRRALACFAPLSSSLTQDSMTNHCLNSYPQRPTWTFLLVEHTRRVSYQIRREMGCEHLAA